MIMWAEQDSKVLGALTSALIIHTKVYEKKAIKNSK